MRLNKFLASSGLTSRRGADVLVQNSKVRVNGKRAVLGMEIIPDRDKVEVYTDAWRLIKLDEKVVVYALNKPVGYVSTVSDPDGKKTVVSLVPPGRALPSGRRPSSPRVFPVGRLDADSCGLILLTNDGELAQRLSHPKTHIEKEYRVVCVFAKHLTQEELEHHLNKVRRGILLSQEERTHPALVELLSFFPGRAVLKVVLSEGKRRQIRRSMQKIQLTVVELERVRIGGLTMASLGLARGKCVTLNRKQFALLDIQPPRL